MGIVSRDGAPGQQPVMSTSSRRPRHRAPAWRTYRGLAAGWLRAGRCYRRGYLCSRPGI